MKTFDLRVSSPGRRSLAADLPPELRAEGRRRSAARGGRSDAGHVVTGARCPSHGVVRQRAQSPAGRAWRRLNTPRDVELRCECAVGCGPAPAAAAPWCCCLARRAGAGARRPGARRHARSVFVRRVVPPGARRVAVAGTFNQWDRGAAHRAGRSSGVWTTTSRSRRQHQYAFVVDGARWWWIRAPHGGRWIRRRNSVVAVTAEGAHL